MNSDFFKEEVICDHLVTTEVKKLWAVELDLLSKLEEVCKKYGLTYYASGGTLLGAVRHKGFIPWDDDIDVQMHVDDYDKLCEVAEKEFQEPYFFQTYETEKGFTPWHGKLRRSDTTGCTEYEYKYHPKWNRGIFLDIFPLYYIPDSDAKYKRLIRKLKRLRKTIGYYSMVEDGIRMNPITAAKCRIIHGFYSLFTDHYGLCRRFLELCGSEKQRTKRIAPLSFATGKENYVWPSEWFDGTEELPFEDRRISAQKMYDARLKKQFGDYHIIKKNASQHSSLIVDADISYKNK